MPNNNNEQMHAFFASNHKKMIANTALAIGCVVAVAALTIATCALMGMPLFIVALVTALVAPIVGITAAVEINDALDEYATTKTA